MFCDMFEEMSKIFDDLDGSLSNTLKNAAKYSVPAFPPVKVVQRKDKITFRFALAGYSKEDFEVTFKKDCMVLSTTAAFNKKEELRLKNETKQKAEKARVLVDSFKTPKFSYKYFVPETKFDFDGTKAAFADGVLTITIPAFEKEMVKEPKKVNIE